MSLILKKGDKMKSLQILSILVLAVVAITLSASETLDKSKIEKDKSRGCVICSEEQ